MTQPTAAPDAPATPEMGAPARILLVEDSEHDRRFFRRALEKSGEPLEITECHDAESALERLKSGRFDLLVTDLNMPGMDGLELVGRAQPLLQDTGVLLLTGTRDIQSVARAVRLHVHDFILKEPREYLRENLLPQITNALRHVRLVRENRRLEQELHLRMAHLEQIHEQLPEALFAILDGDHRVREINTQARGFLGLGGDEPATGRPVEELLANLSPGVARSVGELLARGEPVRNAYVESPNPDGEDRLFLLSVEEFSLPPASTGDVEPGWILSLRDVTPSRPARRGSGDFAFHGIVGRDPAILEIAELIRRVAPLPTSVLVTGPTGSGKEVVARAIHAESDRAKRPFIAVNCTALSKEILESELFGHVRGAFTGAVAPRKGRFREADGGTLFLDEIGDTTESFQTKLLRALDSGQIEPVGQDRPTEVNVRIICATNKDLERQVAAGKFREDLYYRINVVHIRVPPLAERIGDLPILVERFRQEFNEKFHKSVRMVSQDAMRAMAQYNWPGNVRELRHVMERAFVVAQGPTLTLADLPQSVTGMAPAALHVQSASAPPASGPASSAPPPQSHAPAPRFSGADPSGGEIGLIRDALARTGGNIGLAAQELKMHRTTLWRKMRQWGIEA